MYMTIVCTFSRGIHIDELSSIDSFILRKCSTRCGHSSIGSKPYFFGRRCCGQSNSVVFRGFPPLFQKEGESRARSNPQILLLKFGEKKTFEFPAFGGAKQGESRGIPLIIWLYLSLCSTDYWAPFYTI